MRPRLLSALAVSLASTALAEPPAPLPEPKPAETPATVYRLRNSAANDVATTLKDFAAQRKWGEFAVSAEPATNTLVVAGDQSQLQQVAAMVAAIDRRPPTFTVSVNVVRVPAGFAKEAGLGDESACELTPREDRMLTAAFKRARAEGRLDCITRPMLTLTDNQTGFYEVGQRFAVPAKASQPAVNFLVGDGFTLRATPRLSDDEKTVLLRLEAEITTAPRGVAKVQDTQVIQSTGNVPLGGSYVTRWVPAPAPGEEPTEMMVVTTIERIDVKK